MTTKPFIIWTLRRTGGTNFTTWLSKLTGLKSPEHEPFNLDRQYGYVSKKFLETKNYEQLKEEISKILEEPQIIKHCVETVPEEVSYALAEVACKVGYAHLFLYRKDSTNRLLSLYFAEHTGIWGPNMKKEIPKEIFDKPIPIQELIDQEKRDRFQIYAIFTFLKELNSKVFSISFEDIYQIDEGIAFEKCYKIIKELGIAKDEEQLKKEFRSLREQGYQGTREYYKELKGSEELSKKIQELPPFSLEEESRRLDVFTFKLKPDIEYINSLGYVSFPDGEIKRLYDRRWILQYAPKEGVGAELGVYRGHFAEILVRELKPKRIYLVDGWRKFGEKFSWGQNSPYTGFGKLTTKYALEETKLRMLHYLDHSNVVIVEGLIEDFLKLVPEKLDWVYLDSSHSYEATLRELKLISLVLKPDGVIMGDDFKPDPTHQHHGVFRAIHEFIKDGEWRLIACGPAGQWCLKRVYSISIKYPLNVLGEIDNRFVEVLFIDQKPQVFERDKRFSIGGVVILKKEFNQTNFKILAQDAEGEKDVKWFINSPYYANLYPENPNAQKARFLAENLIIKEAIKFYLVDLKNNERALLFEIT